MDRKTIIHARGIYWGRRDGRALCGAKLAEDGSDAKGDPDQVSCPKCLKLIPDASEE